MQIVVNCETRLCSQFLGPGDHFLQSYGAIFTDRAATGSGSLMEPMSTVYIFVRSFVFTCSFGRESDVRSEQALRSGSVALE